MQWSNMYKNEDLDERDRLRLIRFTYNISIKYKYNSQFFSKNEIINYFMLHIIEFDTY